MRDSVSVISVLGSRDRPASFSRIWAASVSAALLGSRREIGSGRQSSRAEMDSGEGIGGEVEVKVRESREEVEVGLR